FERFESKLEQHRGNLARATVELAKDWRSDRVLRRLEALLAVSDRDHSFIVSGTGDVIEPDDGLIGIGSGGPFALAAARALVGHSDLDAKGVVTEAMKIASGICVYTNDHITVQTLKDIVAELDRYIVGQDRAKRAVAIALRNRWRRQKLSPELRDEVAPKN